jgi:hypothetical protein
LVIANAVSKILHDSKGKTICNSSA